jgi:hypothetical protein
VTEFRPRLLYRNKTDDEKVFSSLSKRSNIQLVDTYNNQVKELIESRLGTLASEESILKGIESYTAEKGPIEKQGVWVYYAWRNALVHLLMEQDFIELRTNRNREKIYTEEQIELGKKVVCIIGLSVGRTIATTIASERIAGEIRLADFDSIALSNLNRIKCSLTSLGENKAYAAAREIAEIDPFIKVKCWPEGVNPENLRAFLDDGKKADLLIEECDDFLVKFLSRLEARSLGIPVLMETNDNCIIDVERFDLDRELELFHGVLTQEEVDQFIASPDKESAGKMLFKIFDASMLSSRMKKSLSRIGKELVSWPQLASEIAYGGGTLVGIAKQILLKQSNYSGRLYHKPPNI